MKITGRADWSGRRAFGLLAAHNEKRPPTEASYRTPRSLTASWEICAGSLMPV